MAQTINGQPVTNYSDPSPADAAATVERAQETRAVTLARLVASYTAYHAAIVAEDDELTIHRLGIKLGEAEVAFVDAFDALLEVE